MGLVPALTPFVPGTKIMASAVDAKFDAIVAVVNGGIEDANLGTVTIGAISGLQAALDSKRDDVPVTWGEVTNKPNTFPPSSHTHNAGDINAGTLSTSRIPDLAASKITSGTLSSSRIPNLSADKITSGTLSASRIPNLSAAKITSGTMSISRVSGLGTAATHDVTTSASDTTTGRLVKVGDFGFLSSSSGSIVPVGGLVFASTNTTTIYTYGLTFTANTANEGPRLRLSDGSGNVGGQITYGTWRCLGHSRKTDKNPDSATMWQRIA